MITYLEMHCGPEYCFYYEIAKTSVIVFVCLLFGPLIPLLYCLGIFALLIQYVVDRTTLAYFYRLPPMYSHRLTMFLLRFTGKIPIFSLCLLFWQSTN